MTIEYELPKHNASEEDIHHVFQTAKVIAVVGLSRTHEAPSYRVASYLQEHGYRIIPVRPKSRYILDEKCYPRLEDVPEKIDSAVAARAAIAVYAGLLVLILYFLGNDPITGQ